MWLLRSRFARIEETYWQRLTRPIRRLKWKLDRLLRSFADKLLAKRRDRAFVDRHYPVLAFPIAPPGRWVPDATSSNGRKWEGRRKWRSRLGPAVVCWEDGIPAYRAWNVRMPDGTRQHVRQSLLQWRRRAEPPSVWIYGSLVPQSDDVWFVDLEEQPRYTSPDPGNVPNLEAELACSPAFVADLQDDAFALTAFYLLAKQEWMKVGHREVDTFSGEGEIAHMIAGLRGKGEIFLDVRYQTLSGHERPLERGIFSPDRTKRLHRHLAAIGWRTHTPDEIRALLQDDLRRRLQSRVELLRHVRHLEMRPAGRYPAWKETPRHPPARITILRDGDDKSWLGELTAEELEACSGELSLRISALAITARVSKGEHEKLLSALVSAKLLSEQFAE